jgi:hypothetical protein
MVSYSRAAVELAMKVQEVILRAIAKKITWWQAAEIIGISERQMRRLHERYEEFGRGRFRSTCKASHVTPPIPHEPRAAPSRGLQSGLPI